MANEILTFTPITFRFETEARRCSRKMKESLAAHRVAKCITECGIYNMERLNSMRKEEILAIPGIKDTDYHFIEESLEDFRAEYGDLKWQMPVFDGIEFAYIVHVMIYHKPKHYFDLYQIFSELSQKRNQHPLIDAMSQIYYKLRTIERDEFAAIMATKDVNIEDYKL